MRHINLCEPTSVKGQEERLARLVRHLDARLRDFGPGGPEVVRADQKRGEVAARLPGLSSAQAAARLRHEFGVQTALEGDCLLFRLSPGTRFEDLDYLWGCLNQLL